MEESSEQQSLVQHIMHIYYESEIDKTTSGHHVILSTRDARRACHERTYWHLLIRLVVNYTNDSIGNIR